MIALLTLSACLMSAASTISNHPINTDSIAAITADGQRAHLIQAEMKDGSKIPLLRSVSGSLWLGDHSSDFRWFVSNNLNWRAKKKNCELLLCMTSTVECKCQEVIADSGYSFDDFSKKEILGIQLIGDKKVKGKYPYKIIPLDSIEQRFKVEVNKHTKR